MNEARFEPGPDLAVLAEHMREVIAAIGNIPVTSMPIAKSA